MRVIFCPLEEKHLAAVEELNPITALAGLGYCRDNQRLNAALALWEDEGWLASDEERRLRHSRN